MTDYLWLTIGDIYKKENLNTKALDAYVKVKQIKKQKGATENDKDLQFVERKISEIRKNAL